MCNLAFNFLQNMPINVMCGNSIAKNNRVWKKSCKNCFLDVIAQKFAQNLKCEANVISKFLFSLEYSIISIDSCAT